MPGSNASAASRCKMPSIAYARKHGYHPLRDYLASLRWDGKPRINVWLITKLGAENTDYVHSDRPDVSDLAWWRASSSPAAKPTTCWCSRGRRARSNQPLAQCSPANGSRDNLPDITAGKDAISICAANG